VYSYKKEESRYCISAVTPHETAAVSSRVHAESLLPAP
jgi:hypothetical protein